MSSVESSGKSRPRWRDAAVKPRPVPDDFEATFVRIGRFACQEHYRAGHLLVTAWLNQCGKERLIRERAEYVTKNGEESMGAVVRYGRETVDRWRAEGRKGLEVRDVQAMLDQVFPVEDETMVALETAQAAAAHLRIARNGGWPVSASPNGFWWVGTKLVSAAEMVEFAKRKGFDPASLTSGR